MASQPRPEIPGSFRFEFDPVNKVLLARLEGRLTEASVLEFYKAIQRYANATDASTSIWDCSSVTEFALSADFIRDLARLESPMPNRTRPSFSVIPQTVGFGIGRMYALWAEHRDPLLQVVRTMDEALAELGIQSPHFEPLE
jgi:hypothetical protein